MRMFKLDMVAWAEAIAQALEDEPEDGFRMCFAEGAQKELSRQIHAAGGPSGNLETQLGALLGRWPSGDQKQASAGEALVEELVEIFDKAAEAFEAQDVSQRGNPTLWGIRAVLSHLARRGVEGLPSVDDVAKRWPRDGLPEDGPGGWRGIATIIVRICNEHVTRLLAARDAALADARAELTRTATKCGDAHLRLAAMRVRAEAAEKMRDELQRVLDENVIPRSIAAEKERDALRARLAAVLDLEDAMAAALTPHFSDVFVRIATHEAMALIRSRAGALGAEAPMGATT